MPKVPLVHASWTADLYKITLSELLLQGRTGIEALDDACLTRIFAFLSPLPDLFNVSRVCQVSAHPHLGLYAPAAAHAGLTVYLPCSASIP